MAKNLPITSSSPATAHTAITFAADAAAAVAAGVLYKALYFGVAGVARVVDANGNEENVTVVVGMVYPVQSYGVVTGGATTVTAGSVLGLLG